MTVEGKRRIAGIAVAVLMLALLASATLMLISPSKPPAALLQISSTRPAIPATYPILDLPGAGLTPSGPRSVLTPIPAMSHDAKNGTRDNRDHVGYFSPTCWVRYNAVDFGAGADLLTANISCHRTHTGNILFFHLDTPNSPAIAEIVMRGTNGFEPFTVPVKGASGVRDLFLTCTDGGFNLASFKFIATQSAAKPILAASYSEAFGIREVNGAVGQTDGGDWVKYHQIDFGAGVSSVAIELAMGARPDYTKLELRLDKSDGPLICEFKPESTGSWNDYQTQSAPVQDASGVHDLYIIFHGDRGLPNLMQFQFTANGSVPLPRSSEQLFNDPP